MARILVAEGDPEVRKLITFALRFSGHKIYEVGDREEVLTQIKQETPDLIVIDARPLLVNDSEATKALKNDNTTSSIPVIYLVDSWQENAHLAQLNSDDALYLIKPISPDELTKKVEKVLRLESKRHKG